MIFDKHPEYKKKGNRHFWAREYYVDTVGRNEKVIRNYIKNQTNADMIEDKMNNQ